MGWGISLPSLPSVADIRNRVADTVGGAAERVRDFGDAAVERASDLGRKGLDLGRQGVQAVRDFDVREAAATVREGIGKATEAGRQGISDGVSWASERVGDGADLARNQITGDDLLSRGARGVITVQEQSTRFTLGAVGGVAREVVGAAGAVGQLGTTAVEAGVSAEARADYGQQVADFAGDAANATGDYVGSVVNDPSRLTSDASNAWNGASGFVEGQVDRYGQVIADGRGEVIGMDVGTVATYVVPVGGGPARGALTGAVREGTEAAVRGTVRSGDEIVDVARGANRAGDLAPAQNPITAAAQRTGIPEDTIRDIVSTPKPNRPEPATYMSAGQVSNALAKFDDGAIRITSRESFVAHGTLGPPGGFIMPAREFEGLVNAAKGDLRVVEQKLGLENGALSGQNTLVAFVKREDLSNLRLPSGNESGANTNWLPGGYTSGGLSEAIVDFPKGTKYIEVSLDGSK